MNVGTLIVASDAKELAAGQHSLIADIGGKIEAAKDEAKAAHDMVVQLREVRLGSAQAKRLHRRATARVGYLVKIKQALEAGYVMMPDMPAELVAVRTARHWPAPAAKRWRSGGDWVVPQLPPSGEVAGDGEYKHPRYATETTKRTRELTRHDGSKYKDDYSESRAVEVCDPDGINRQFMRPEIMSRTAAAMTLKIFDEIATVTPTSTKRGRRGPDPIVLGRVVDPVSGKAAAFLIAWFVDTETV